MFGQQLSEPGLGDYLRFGYVPAPGCILEHVWKLRAAEMATISTWIVRRNATRTTYWQLTDHTPVDVAPEKWLGEFDERLSHSVQQKLMSDVPLGAFLSGGMDSAAVVGHTARHEAGRTYTIGFRVSLRRDAVMRDSRRLYQTDHSVGE